MPSDITRRIFDKEKHYTSVIMQQGRVMLDSDHMAQEDIHKYRRNTQTIDVIGQCGVPRNSNAFKIGNGGNMFSITPGRFYINGLLCELSQQLFYYNQPYYPNPPFLSGGVPDSPPSSPPGSPPDAPLLNLDDGRHIVYLKAWEREITALDDPRIQEVALGGADTTSRLQTVWQVGVLKAENGLSCPSSSELWKQYLAKTTGRMNARTSAVALDTDPCGLQQSGGYRRLENQLYRIEIHKGGSRNQATYKWSRDNASIETRIKDIDQLTIHVEHTGKDDVLGFAAGQWVEFVNESTSLNHVPYALSKITEVNPARSEIVLESKDSNVVFGNGMKLRKWDQVVSAPNDKEGLELPTDWSSIEGGIEVKFEKGTYKSGDYWLIPARTNTSEIEWLGGSNSPHGIMYSFCKLAIMDIANNQITGIQDCRPHFPSLTELNEIGKGSCCTYHVKPDEGWESVFDFIGRNQSAKVCFEVGVYNMANPKVIEHKGHLVLEGSGQGTVITAANRQVALRFNACSSVNISDLSVSTSGVKNAAKKDHISLKGSLTFDGVKEISLERVWVKCGHGASPSASAVYVFCPKSKPAHVRIENSVFLIGYMQHGVIIINSARVLIANNRISTSQRPGRLKFTNRLATNWFRNAVMRRMIGNISDKRNDKTNMTVNHGKHNISFRTDPELGKNRVWKRLIEAEPPKGLTKKMHLKNHLLKKTSSLLLDRGALEASPFKNYIKALSRQDPSLSYQGIVIGGETGNSVHIVRNQIDGMLQGIHIGLSHSAPRNVFDEFGIVKIEKNTITNILPPIAYMGRHGIFVGNCKNLVIDDNDMRLKRLPKAISLGIDAIRLWGKFGDKLQVSNNYIGGFNNNSQSYSVGIRIESIEPIAPGIAPDFKWKIVWNTIFSKGQNKIPPTAIFNKYKDTNTGQFPD